MLPSVITVGNKRSTIVAATVSSHGDTFSTVWVIGPSFPAEKTTVMPFATACNVPGKSDGAPIDRDNTSTPSWMASSMAFMIPAPLHPASIGYEP